MGNITNMDKIDKDMLVMNFATRILRLLNTTLSKDNTPPDDRQVVGGVYELIKQYYRAWKLMLEGKNFLVISENEEYFMNVYYVIKSFEERKKTWTAEDEEKMQKSKLKWLGERQ